MDPIIIDAGPSLNFLATHNERVLFAVVNRRLAAPETVQREVLGKSRSDPRLAAASGVWKKLTHGKWIEVLPDAVTPDMEAAARNVIAVPLARQQRQARDLGEIMVVIHAVRLAQEGRNVGVIIDDTEGAKLANNQRHRLDRLRQRGLTVGKLTVFGTHSILEQAVRVGHITDKAMMRKIYRQLRACDDGLVDIKQTHLLSADIWPVRDVLSEPTTIR